MGDGLGGFRHRSVAPAWPVPGLLSLVAAGLAAAVAVPVRYGVTGRTHAATVSGLVMSGGVAVASALVVLLWWGRQHRRGDRAELWRALFALATLAWGLGQLTLGGAAARDALAYPALGDLVSAAAAPLGLIALLSVPRRSVSSWPGLRLAMDAVTLGLAEALAVWRWFLVDAGSGRVLEPAGTIVFVVADTSVLALVLLAAVRDVRSRLLAGLVGVLSHVVADVTALVAAAQEPRQLPWSSAALWCLAWPLIAIGIYRYRPRPSDDDGGAVRDRREVGASQTATLLGSTLFVVALLSPHAPLDERGSLVLAVVTVAAIGVRELLGSQLRLQLTTGLRNQAFRDPLTRLANRSALTLRISALNPADPWVVLTLDIDGFKQINDVLGSAAADAVLAAVGRVLGEQCPPQGLVARLGGDEFAVLSPGDLADGTRLAERLRASVRRELERHIPELGASASVGVGSLAPDSADGDSGRDRMSALLESGAALRSAKAAGRDRVEVYAGAVAAERERRLVLERRLRHAVDHHEVAVFGQPVVDLSTGLLRSFESLARWTDAELGPISPGEFIPAAEETGLIVGLGQQLMDRTLAEATAAGAFRAGLSVAINASPIQLRVPGFTRVVRHLLERHGVPAGQLVIEVTEAILVTEDDPALRTLTELAVLGTPIAIDDFGTGYSAMGYLRRLPVDILKIDQSLTRSLASEPRTMAIVEGTVRLAHRMGVRVVMEGIEDDVMAAACRGVGADLGQGWLFGRPAPWTDARDMIAAQPKRMSGSTMGT